jgi:predicted GIY-YIG superfamily endonuclease
MGQRQFYVYILASRIGGTLYIGVTNDLVRRCYEHREKLVMASHVATMSAGLSISSASMIPKMPYVARNN